MNAVTTPVRPTTAVAPIDLVRELYADFGRGDVDAIVDRLAPGFTWRFIGDPAAPYSGTFTTTDAVRGFFAAVAATDEMLAFEPREFIAQGEHVTVIGWERCRPHGGRPFDTDWVHVFSVRDGRITRFLGMFDTNAAAQARAA